ncbi:transcriptional regulator [Actinoplanes ianthinogenes]|uniref:Transcriptional regulator n=1 Tax=Actinoplanes ianthinogenes TaxID=122358 RepID=A0ABM7LQX9_9ACTN|nr:helix-turn-helix transcriptional regulator [Actinoplanes ianthinogenes]BCJ41630.1 transcriptional regulator [Actinoplanes ianthinogenes]GGR28788.1 transcriptional regulator [Actinoplanes ianthinogenes]
MADPLAPSGDTDPRALGLALRAARKSSGLTGSELARRAGMSQAKISRLETGVTLADPADVRALAGAMALPQDRADALVSQAERAQQLLTDLRPEPRDLPELQDAIHRAERESTEIRIFNPALVPGLMQTSSYARGVITTLGALSAADPTAPETRQNLLAAVSRRIARQEILGVPGKTFSFVVTESVLGTGVGTPEDMLVQIRQIRQVAALPNVSFRILPARAFVTDFALHPFEVIDSRVVMMDLFNTSLTVQGRADVRLYRNLFARLEQAATADVEALLDEYTEYYRRQVGR